MKAEGSGGALIGFMRALKIRDHIREAAYMVLSPTMSLGLGMFRVLGFWVSGFGLVT